MSTLSFSLADVNIGNLLVQWHSLNHVIREGVTIFGALGLVTLLMLLWAIFLRRRRRRHHRHDYPLPERRQTAACPAGQTGNSAAIESPRHRGWHRPRRPHRPRNPTLAETGGLPPIRPEPPWPTS